jgi:organic hydroperoxide reductase OsmC/OhrA
MPMSGREHHYRLGLRWTGNTGAGTATYGGYRRDHDLIADGKPPILATADPVFRGDPSRWNPEELLVAALSSCHQLSYLSLCARAGISIVSYEDEAEGTMVEVGDGGSFTSVTLRPRVVVAAGTDLARAEALHHTAHEQCFIASSVTCPVGCEAIVEVESAG